MTATAVGSPDVEWRRIFGVMWDLDESEPLCHYTDYQEAYQVAAAAGGYIVQKMFGFTGWVPVEADDLP